MEEFCYNFLDKSHEEKSEYLVMRTRVLYCDHMNDKEDAQDLIDHFVADYRTADDADKFLRE